MDKAEKQSWLIREMQKEMPRYANYPIPAEAESRWKLLRGFFNVRPTMAPVFEVTPSCSKISRVSL